MYVCLCVYICFKQLKNFKSFIFQTLTKSLNVHFIVVSYESIVMLTSLLIVECSCVTFSDFLSPSFQDAVIFVVKCGKWVIWESCSGIPRKKIFILLIFLFYSFLLSFSFPFVSYISFFTCPPHYLNKKKLLFFILL